MLGQQRNLVALASIVGMWRSQSVMAPPLGVAIGLTP